MEKQAAEQMVEENQKFLVYFLGVPIAPFSSEMQYVKIGRSSSKWIAERRQKNQVGCPLKQVCLGVIPYPTVEKCRDGEEFYQDCFLEDRIYDDRREWFYASEELLALIRSETESLSDYELPLGDNYKNKIGDDDES